MAYIPVRIRCEFRSMDGTYHSVLVGDTDWGGFPADFETDSDGYSIEYDDQNGESYKALHGSSLNLNIIVESSNESAFQLFITNLLQAQEDRFYMKVLKGSNDSNVPGDIWDEFYYEVYNDNTWTVEPNCNGVEPSWYGQVVQDLVEYEDLPNPYKFKIVANDGLSKLSKVEYTGELESFTAHMIGILQTIGMNDLWGSYQPHLLTSVQWFENNMNAGTFNVDPLSFTRFAPIGVWYDLDASGNNIYPDNYEVLETIIGMWNARLFMANGQWNIIQNDQLPSKTVTYSQYSKNFASITPGSGTGILVTDGSINLSATVDNSINDKTVGNQLAGSLYRFLPALKNAKTKFNFTASSVVFAQGYADFSSPINVNTIVGNGIVALRFEFQSIVNYSGITLPTVGSIQVNLIFIFTIKLVTGSGTYYYSNNQTSSGWGTNLANYTATKLAFIGTSSGTITESVKFNTDTIPASGILSVQLVTRLRGRLTGANYDGNVDDDETYAKINYINAGGDLEGVITYRASNDDYPQSSAVADLGEALLVDSPDGPDRAKLEVYKDGTDGWVDSINWKREGVGTAYQINQLRCIEVVAAQKSPIRNYQGVFKYGNISFRSVISYKGVLYAVNGGVYYARPEEWDATYFEVGRDATNITATDEFVDDDATFDDVVNEGPDETKLIGDGIKDLYKFGSTSSDITSTPITTISVDALLSSQVTIRKGDTIELTNPSTGDSQTFTVSADASAGAISISVVSQALTDVFPTGSILSFTGQQYTQKIGAPDTDDTSSAGTLTNSSGAYTAIVSAEPPFDGYYRVAVAINAICNTANDTLHLRIHDGTGYIYFTADFVISGINGEVYPFAVTTGNVYLVTADPINLEYKNETDWDYTNAAIILIKTY